MHLHPVPQEPGYTPAYCLDHAPEDTPLFECWSELKWHQECVVCEDVAFCATCQAREEERATVGAETFSLVMHDPESSVTWNIDKAWQIVHAFPRSPRIIGTNSPDYRFQGGEVDPDHLEHVPTEQREVPGLAVVLDNVQPDGTRQVLLVQIDGSHRAALAEREGRPRLVYLLTEQEHTACVMLYLVDDVPQALPSIAGPAPVI